MIPISEFQLALIGAAVVAVACVWAYNGWQEYRHRKAADKIFRGNQDDVLLGGGQLADAEVEVAQPQAKVMVEGRAKPRIEPVFSQSLAEPVEALVSDDDVPHAADRAESAVPSLSAAASHTPGEDFIDPMIETGLALPPGQSVAALQAAWREANIKFSKRIRWIGRDTGNGEWVEMSDSATSGADHGHVTIQLADRQGAIDLRELDAFCQLAQAVAVAQGGQLDTPAMDEIVDQARSIDEFCASVDIQIAMHMIGRSGQAFTGTKLRGLLEASGLQLAQDGFFYLQDGDGRRLISVCNTGSVPFNVDQLRTGSTPNITFWLDVPRVSNGAAAFDAMLVTARQLAEALDGLLVDDQRNPLADNMLSSIRAKVVELQTRMAEHDIPAGERRALQLFS